MMALSPLVNIEALCGMPLMRTHPWQVHVSAHAVLVRHAGLIPLVHTAWGSASKRLPRSASSIVAAAKRRKPPPAPPVEKEVDALKMSMDEARTLDDLVQLYEENKAQLTNVHLTACTLRSAHLVLRDVEDRFKFEQLTDKVVEHLVSRLDTLTPRELARCLWSWGRASYCPDKEIIFFRFLKKFSESDLDEVKAHQICKMVISLVNLNLYDHESVDVLLWILEDRIADLKPAERADLIWGLGQLGHFDLKIMRKLCGFALDRKQLRQYQPLDVAKILQGMAKMGHHDKGIIKKLTTDLGTKLPGLNIHNLADCIQALAKMKHHDGTFLQAFCSIAAKKIVRAEPLDIIKLLEALKRFKHYDRPLFVATTKRILQQRSKYRIEELTWMLSMLSQLGHRDPVFVALLSSQLESAVELIKKFPETDRRRISAIGEGKTAYVSTLFAAFVQIAEAATIEDLIGVLESAAVIRYSRGSHLTSLLQQLKVQSSDLTAEALLSALASLTVILEIDAGIVEEDVLEALAQGALSMVDKALLRPQQAYEVVHWYKLRGFKPKGWSKIEEYCGRHVVNA